MTSPPFVRLETMTYTAPLGVGFWDAASHRLVSDGLAVTVHSLVDGSVVRSRVARAGRSGIFAAQGFDELRTFEAGSGDDAFWASPPATREYLVEVQDGLGQFTSFVMHVDIPARGLVMPACVSDLWPMDPASPPTSPIASPLIEKPLVYVPLFNAPARVIPARLAVVRATLLDAATGDAAVWAVLELRYEGMLVGRGIADEEGQVVVAFPFPEPTTPIASSPSGASPTAQPLTNQSWPIDVDVRYAAHLPTYAVGTTKQPVALADLCEILHQPLTTARTSLSPLSHPITGDTLRFGEALTVANAPLFIDPA